MAARRVGEGRKKLREFVICLVAKGEKKDFLEIGGGCWDVDFDGISMPRVCCRVCFPEGRYGLRSKNSMENSDVWRWFQSSSPVARGIVVVAWRSC